MPRQSIMVLSDTVDNADAVLVCARKTRMSLFFPASLAPHALLSSHP
ncbi:MAG: hypothetical protein ACD_23C00811G0002 [uncultured bacterium]|nr:MAG: hypothetical protein ACD_23C00811G0002 [uncultured bacterium]